MYQSLLRLPGEYAQVLYLTYFENMQVSEIGRVMGKTPRQIYNLTARGKIALRSVMERMGLEKWDLLSWD